MPKKESADRVRDLHALRNLIDQAQDVVTSLGIPEDRTRRATKLLTAALMLTDDLIAVPPAAVSLGQRGGLKTAERGPEYFKKIAGMRKTRAGGRPKQEIS